jgi:hypothetical protein
MRNVFKVLIVIGMAIAMVLSINVFATQGTSINPKLSVWNPAPPPDLPIPKLNVWNPAPPPDLPIPKLAVWNPAPPPDLPIPK